MKRVIWTSVATLSLMACVGCGDDKKNSGVSVDTGLDGTKVVGTLTPTEFTQFCNGLGTADQKAISKADGCKMGGYMAAFGLGMTAAAPPADADLQAACKAYYDECMQATPAATQKQCQQDATCTATVAEAEACYAAGLEDTVDAMKSVPSCSAITAQTFQQDAGASSAPETPAECTALSSKCPTWTTVAAIPTG
jgi:hypothetical protein